MEISPAGGDGDGFALRGDLLCPRRQSRQNAAGGRRLEKHSVFLCRRAPDPLFFYGGAIKRRCISIRRGQKSGHRFLRRPLPLCVGRTSLFSYKSHCAWLPSIAGRFGGRFASVAGAGCTKTAAKKHTCSRFAPASGFVALCAHSVAVPFRLPSLRGGYIQ